MGETHTIHFQHLISNLVSLTGWWHWVQGRLALTVKQDLFKALWHRLGRLCNSTVTPLLQTSDGRTAGSLLWSGLLKHIYSIYGGLLYFCFIYHYYWQYCYIFNFLGPTSHSHICHFIHMQTFLYFTVLLLSESILSCICLWFTFVTSLVTFFPTIK